MNYDIITDSSNNLPRHITKELSVRVLSLSFFVGEDEFVNYAEDETFDIQNFYERMRQKEPAKTSLINVELFESAFEQSLKEGNDVLAVVVSGGVSGTYQAAKIAAESLRERYRERKIIVVDSLSGSFGLGLLVYYAAKMRAEGSTIEETADWLYKNRMHMVHRITVEDLFYLKRSGRLSGGVALIGSLLHIKPIIHANNEGKLIAQAKVAGRKKVLNLIAQRFTENAIQPENQVIAICHGDCIEDAEYLARKIKEKANVKDIMIEYCDPVLGAHAGPGVVALFYLGKER